jgi:iron complex transport system substrate-binding protein
LKICCLLPSGAEILWALGLADSVIGVSDLCDYPADILESKPVVSRSKVDPAIMSSEEVESALRDILNSGESPYELDYEWLAKELPDIVFTQDLCHICEIDAGEVNQAVRGMSVQPRVVVLQPRTFADILDSIIEVGEVCGVPGRAWQLVDGLRHRAEAVTSRLKSTTARPSVFSLEGINPLVVGGHWIPDLLQMSGGNVASLEPGCDARRLEWEEVLEAAPERLLVDLCSSDVGRHLREVPWLAAQPGWQEIPAVASGEVYLIDHSYFSCPGPRVVVGLEILAQITHPDLFSGMIPPGAVVKLDPEAAHGVPPGRIAECFRPFP